MKQIANFDCPETYDELISWKPKIIWRPLAHNILAVATLRAEGAWKSYIGVVLGKNHDNEYQEILNTGTPIRKEIAIVIFPEFKEIPYAK